MDALALDEARSRAEAALAEAARRAVQVTVVVVDAHGHDVVVLRMPGAAGFTPAVARAKARTAAYLGMDTSAVADLDDRHPALLPVVGDDAGLRLCTLLGGLVIRGEHAVRGAIAVSGASPEVDVLCASAGLA